MTKEKKIGYGQPPKETRFKKGKSGNPKGKPRGTKSMHTLLTELINQKIIVNQNGKPIKISKKTAMLMQLINKGVKGDLKAIQILYNNLLEADVKEEERKKVLKSLSTDDQKIIKDYLEKKTSKKEPGYGEE